MIRYHKPNIPDLDGGIISDIIQSGWVSNGKWNRALENYFKENYGVKYAFTCSNATTGLIMAIDAADWSAKSVSLPAFTWPSTRFAIEHNCCEHYYVDINKDTWLPEHIRDGFRHDERTVMVDIFGNQSLSPMLSENTIYDAAHGFDLPDLGHRGLAEVVSFSHTKLVTGTEGGIILTNNDELASKLYVMRRMYGRMEEINAYIVSESIKRYYENKDTLTEIVEKYKTKLDFSFKVQQGENKNNSVFAIMFDTKRDRDKAVHAMADNEIECKVYYEPLTSCLPNTNYVYDHILALPVYVEMGDQLDFIIETINRSQK